MCSKLIDTDAILSGNEQWTKLEEQWGNPIDLETDEDQHIMSPVISTLDLRKTTFDSSFLFKKKRMKTRHYSKQSLNSNIEYKDFLKELKDDEHPELPLKQFYFISGQILSALSVEEICDKIDDIFRSVDRLSSATSTVRKKKPVLPERVQCSIDISDLSFDDTHHSDDEKEKNDEDDISRYIDEAFEQLNATINTINNEELRNMDQSTRDSVTTLVHKFSSILTSPVVYRSPRRKRQCNEKFRDLAEFWKKKALEK